MSQVRGTFGMLDFTMLQPVLVWRAFLKFEPFISLISEIFFGPRSTAENCPPVLRKDGAKAVRLLRCMLARCETQHGLCLRS